MDKMKPHTLYRSIYKCDYEWPKIFKRTIPVLFKAEPIERCKEEKPAEPCVCQAQFCICKKNKRRDKDDPINAEDDLEAFEYLKGVKSTYKNDFFKDGFSTDLGVVPFDSCPKLETPNTRIWNPYLVPKDAFRPGQSRPLGCKLTFGSFSSPVDYEKTMKQGPPQPTLEDISQAMQFPVSLQEKISLTNMKAQKIAICRKRPKAIRKIM